MSAKIREWAEKNAQPVKTIEEVEEEGIETPVEEADAREVEEAEPSDPYGRIPGRIREWAAQASEMGAVQSQTSMEDAESEHSSRQPKPDRWSPTESSISAKEVNLFGPPPVQNDFDLSTTETIMHSNTIKQRTNRRSDQRRNRLFSENSNVVELVHLDAPRMHKASGSGSSSAKIAFTAALSKTEGQQRVLH
ncbi:hypothetical protein AAVH_00624 [Aphelenchoides avenae]|nr:hypothetical protein AAVH_00624 [Aphelenchus avenae]